MTTATEQLEAVRDSPMSDRVEVLRQILTNQQHRPVDYDEAQEIGDSLIAFYQALAEEEPDEFTD
jgi:hypothetical protein